MLATISIVHRNYSVQIRTAQNGYNKHMLLCTGMYMYIKHKPVHCPVC